MNDKKLSKLEEDAKADLLDYRTLDKYKYRSQEELDLITSYRELQKENADIGNSSKEESKKAFALCGDIATLQITNEELLEAQTKDRATIEELLGEMKYIKGIADKDPKGLEEAEIFLAKIFRKALYSVNKHSPDSEAVPPKEYEEK